MTLDIRLSHQFPDFQLEADLSLPDGLTCLFGRSGSGKTTLVNAIAGLLTPDRADIRLDGQALHDLPPHRRGVGYVFQDARLFPHLTVERNLTYAFAASRWKASTGSPAFWASGGYCRGDPAPCREASGSGWPSAGRFCRGPGFF
jgi:molybdate transport system ATP-binding protein